MYLNEENIVNASNPPEWFIFLSLKTTFPLHSDTFIYSYNLLYDLILQNKSGDCPPCNNAGT